MSGIYGAFCTKKCGKREDWEQRLASWNYLYGRDGQEIYGSENAFWGKCIESTLSLDRAYADVSTSSKKKYIADALVFNRVELIEAIINTASFTNDELRKMSDSELLFIYIDCCGISALKAVNGDFAGMVYDEQQQTVTLFRDHLGVRPLFYYFKNGVLCFSTDIRGILAIPEFELGLSEKYVFESLMGRNKVNLTDTEYENIREVRPAGYITFSLATESVQEKQYWELGKKKIRLRSEKAYFAELYRLIDNATAIRAAKAKGYIGAELSGGLDSGVLSILLNRQGNKPICYSWSAAPEKLPLVENDERYVIKDICEQEQLTCYYGETYIKNGPECDVYAESLKMFGEGFYSGVSDYALPPHANTMTIVETAQCMREHGMKVVFTGHSGDEGVSHRCSPYEMYYHHEYFHYLKYYWDATSNSKDILRHFKHCIEKAYKHVKYLKDYAKRKNVRNNSEATYASDELVKKYGNEKVQPFAFAYDPIYHINHGGIRNRLENVAMYGAYSNVRYFAPFADFRVIDFAVSIPRHLYLKYGEDRYIYRETFKDIMPASLYRVTEKQTPSEESVEAKDPEYELEIKKMLETADRSYWERYFNFDELEKLTVKKQEKTAEDERLLTYMTNSLFVIFMGQGTIDKVRNLDYSKIKR